VPPCCLGMAKFVQLPFSKEIAYLGMEGRSYFSLLKTSFPKIATSGRVCPCVVCVIQVHLAQRKTATANTRHHLLGRHGHGGTVTSRVALSHRHRHASCPVTLSFCTHLRIVFVRFPPPSFFALFCRKRGPKRSNCKFKYLSH
jgi:hypothetical protein